MYQERYWAQLKDLRTQVFFLNFYAAESENRDKAVDIFLAFTSSASIAAWAIWQHYPMLWALIIAISQVVTATKSFLPYKKRLKIIPEFSDAIEAIALESEKGWFYVAEGLLTLEEINDKYFDLAEKLLKAEKKFMTGMVLPRKVKLLKRAEVEADKYLTTRYYQGG